MVETFSRQSAVRAVAGGKGGHRRPGCAGAASRRRANTLLHGVALALVVTGRVSLLGLFLCGVMERFADDDSARRAGGGGEWIAVGEFVTEVCAARAERHVADGTRGGVAGEQASDDGQEE